MNSRALIPNLPSAHVSAWNDFLYIEFRCPDAPTELRNLKMLGVKACARQNNSDQMALVVDLAEALHLDPASSLVGSAISPAGVSTPNYCARAFKAAEKLCPTGFPSVSIAERDALNKAANGP
jgi:hypothetical protein